MHSRCVRRSCRNCCIWRPSCDDLLCLCSRVGLRADEPQKLLLHAGYAQIYDWVPRDSILFYALDNGMSSVACNQQLDERGEAILG